MTDWFEPLYRAAERGEREIPWDRGEPNPAIEAWVRGLDGTGRRALVVGSGTGDDAELVAELGFATTAFDIAETAVAIARRRFPGSRVDYRVADLLDPPAEWAQAFDFVLESITVQSMPVSTARGGGRRRERVRGARRHAVRVVGRARGGRGRRRAAVAAHALRGGVVRHRRRRARAHRAHVGRPVAGRVQAAGTSAGSGSGNISMNRSAACRSPVMRMSVSASCDTAVDHGQQLADVRLDDGIGGDAARRVR